MIDVIPKKETVIDNIPNLQNEKNTSGEKIDKIKANESVDEPDIFSQARKYLLLIEKHYQEIEKQNQELKREIAILHEDNAVYYKIRKIMGLESLDKYSVDEKGVVVFKKSSFDNQ